MNPAFQKHMKGLKTTEHTPTDQIISRLQIVSASVDELTCRFIDLSGRKHVIHATITETYPSCPPVWFSESEDAKVSEAVSCLSSTSGLDNHLLYQVKLLLTNLCNQFSLSGILLLDSILIEKLNPKIFQCQVRLKT